MMVAPRIDRLASDDGLRIFDPIETQECRLYAATPVEPVAADAERFGVPIDAAVTIRTEALTLPDVAAVYVRDEEMAVRGEILHDSAQTFGAGAYLVELSLSVKLYLRVCGPMTVASGERTTVTFDGEREVVVGVRSYHDRPAATVTTTDDPRDLMRALSTFGSALKTHSPERSYPTLRGHPPLIERGESFERPAGIDDPETGVRLALPADRRYVYSSASLAYYLGATVRPGDRPALSTADGWRHPLDADGDGPSAVADAMNRALKRAVFLDCCARTEGLYDTDLYERRAVEDRLDLDFAALYDRPLAERLPAYFAAPYEELEELLPTWGLAATVPPDPANAETLPYLADSLTLLEPGEAGAADAERGRDGWRREMASELDGFFRNDPSGNGRFDRGPAPARLSGRPAAYAARDRDAIAETFVGPTRGAWRGSVAMRAGFEHRLAHAETEGPLRIVVVCNDEEMLEEGATVDEAYREMELFETDVRHDVGVDGLRETLARDADFLHYIGHIDEEGFVCADGTFDAREMDAVGPSAFFLNACASYEQGAAMVERGSVAGVVTNAAVANEGATRIGMTFARLLNAGFSVYSALNISRVESVHGGQYAVLGDGRVTVSQSPSFFPYLVEIHSGDEGYEFGIESHQSTGTDVGGMIIPHVTGCDRYYICYGRTELFDRPVEEVRSFIADQPCPIVLDDELHWSTELDL